MTQMPPVSRKTESAVFRHMLSKYEADPAWVKRHLPEIGEIMAQAVAPPRTTPSPFGLTERERAFRIESLPGVDGLDALRPEEAIKTLERVAALILDDSLPFEFNHQALTQLFEAAFGVSPRSFAADTVIPVNQKDGGDDAAYTVSMTRGVILNLDENMRLASSTIIPRKIRERDKLMSIVGIAHDSKRDVAARHDDYLAEISPYGDDSR